MPVSRGNPDYHGHYPGDGGEAACSICKPTRRYIGIDKPVVEHPVDDPEDYLKAMAKTATLPHELEDNDIY